MSADPSSLGQPTENPARRRARALYAAVAAGWERWEPHFEAFTAPLTAELLAALDLQPGARVLDIGCGTGSPALALAAALGPTGRVLAVDPTEEMLRVAHERAAAREQTNVEFRLAAIEECDLSPESFDAVVSRWGIIFCEDAVGQLARIRRWLRPDGRIALSTWTPMENSPGFLAVNHAVSRRLDLPPPDPDKPGMQNLSRPGRLAEALREAGYRDVQTRFVRLSTVVCDGNEYWDMMRDTGATLRAALLKLPPAEVAHVGTEVAAAVEAFHRGGVLRIPATAQLGFGRS